MSDIRTNTINSLSDLITKAWYKYDPKITTVLKTLGFKTVKEYVNSNQKAHNFYRVIDRMKTSPQDGVAGIFHNMKNMVNSNQFSTLLWIEDNVEKYALSKSGSESVQKLATGIRKYFAEIKNVPGVLDIEMEYKHVNNIDNGHVTNNKNEYSIELKILYDSTIHYHQKNGSSVRIDLNDVFIQNISIPIKLINMTILKLGDVNLILKELIDSKTLSSSFRFAGPNMFTNNGSNLGQGCLGTRAEEFNEIVQERDFVRYISFITDWGKNYIEEVTGPYRSPKDLIRSHDVIGWTDPNMRELLNSNYPIGRTHTLSSYCKVYQRIERRTVFRGMEISSHHVERYGIKRLGMNEGEFTTSLKEKICSICVLTECEYHPTQSLEPVKETIDLTNIMNPLAVSGRMMQMYDFQAAVDERSRDVERYDDTNSNINIKISHPDLKEINDKYELTAAVRVELAKLINQQIIKKDFHDNTYRISLVA